MLLSCSENFGQMTTTKTSVEPFICYKNWHDYFFFGLHKFCTTAFLKKSLKVSLNATQQNIFLILGKIDGNIVGASANFRLPVLFFHDTSLAGGALPMWISDIFKKIYMHLIIAAPSNFAVSLPIATAWWRAAVWWPISFSLPNFHHW